MNRPVLALGFAFAFALAVLAPRGGAAERIVSYDAAIAVDEGGELTVTETIAVRAEGKQIRRGIYRDFPTTYEGSYGLRVTVPFDVESVTRDGAPEPYSTSRHQNGVRVRIGSADRFLAPGEYVYAITYRTGRQLGVFDDHDELYWNVTGNGWDFPIDRATAAVRLPASVPLPEVILEGYTGPQGSRDTGGFTARADPAVGALRFETTRPLPPHQGLTIVVSFPKGHVTSPTFAEQVFEDRTLLVGLPLFLLVLGYYFFAWRRVGVDPEGGTIIPEYEPPLGLSPAATRHVWRMGFDQTCVTAALLGLAQRGALRIIDDDGDMRLERVHDVLRGVPVGERKVFNALLKGKDELELANTNHARVKKAVDALKLWLNEEHEGKLFLKNRGWLVPGVLLSIASLVAILFSGDFVAGAVGGFLTFWLSIWTIAVVALLSATAAAWRGRGVGSKAKAVFLTCFSVPFVIGELIGLFFLMRIGSIWMGPLLVLFIGTNAVFFLLMKAPTGPGRRVMDQIEGLRMYLGTAEKDRLEASTAWRATKPPPEKTVEQFERFLPYAVALGVENTWADEFSDVLAAAAQPDGTAYHPAWYVGSFSPHRLGAFTQTVSSGLSSAISSSSSPPGSSSGSSSFGGGGGFSGGGGGGGGGGGW